MFGPNGMLAGNSALGTYDAKNVVQELDEEEEAIDQEFIKLKQRDGGDRSDDENNFEAPSQQIKKNILAK